MARRAAAASSAPAGSCPLVNPTKDAERPCWMPCDEREAQNGYHTGPDREHCPPARPPQSVGCKTERPARQWTDAGPDRVFRKSGTGQGYAIRIARCDLLNLSPDRAGLPDEWCRRPRALPRRPLPAVLAIGAIQPCGFGADVRLGMLIGSGGVPPRRCSSCSVRASKTSAVPSPRSGALPGMRRPPQR